MCMLTIIIFDFTSDEPPQKRRKNGRVSFHEEDPMLFGAALRVYDRNRQCLLGSGLYQVVLSDLQPRETPPGRAASWLSVQDTQVSGFTKPLSNPSGQTLPFYGCLCQYRTLVSGFTRSSVWSPPLFHGCLWQYRIEVSEVTRSLSRPSAQILSLQCRTSVSRFTGSLVNSSIQTLSFNAGCWSVDSAGPCPK